MSAKPNGSLTWADLMPEDQERAIAFYSGLLGWEAEPGPSSLAGYTSATLDGANVAGIAGPMPGAPQAWTFYLETDDIEHVTGAVTDHGGHLIVPPMRVPDQGTMAICVEPAGAVFGFWQPGAHGGFGAFGAPGAFGWAEFYSTDAAATVEFFTTILPLESNALAETDEFTYYQLSVGGQAAPQFGVMQINDRFPEGTQPPAGDPIASRRSAAHITKSSSVVYLVVGDCDASAAQAVALGGTLQREPVDTPFGRLADVLDTEGALIKLIDPSKATGSM